VKDYSWFPKRSALIAVKEKRNNKDKIIETALEFIEVK
jgi:hypothetical protein